MENQTTSAIDRLKQLVRSQKTVEFPGEDSPDAEVQAAAEELRKYDQLVSTAVIMAIHGSQVDLNAIRPEPGLSEEIVRLRVLKPPDTGKILDRMNMYKDRLDRMRDSVREVIKERGS